METDDQVQKVVLTLSYEEALATEITDCLNTGL